MTPESFTKVREEVAESNLPPEIKEAVIKGFWGIEQDSRFGRLKEHWRLGGFQEKMEKLTKD